MKTTTGTALLTFVCVSLFSGVAHAHGAAKEHDSKQEAVVEKEQTDWGIAGDAADAKRTVTVAMLDKMRFDPASVKVKAGETVRFVIQNKGLIMHEFVLGNKKSLDSHAAMMIKFPKMEHEEPYMAHVAPGETGEIIWKFNRGGNFHFACLIPGHYQAGMIGALTVPKISGGHGYADKAAHDEPMEHDHGHTKHGKKKHTH